MGCKKAQGFLEQKGLTAADISDASKNRRGRDEALAVARAADKVVVGRGKKVFTFDMKKDPPDEATLLAHILGPSGNLRAPTIRKGKTLVVGFNPAAYEQVLGGKAGSPQ
jgi:arsenate reductase-like glutaredoxin family protein